MQIILANALCAALLLAFMRQRWSISRSVIEPGFVFAISLLLLYPLRAYVLFFFGERAIPQYMGVLRTSNLQLASWLSVLGTIGYIIGYQLVMRKHVLLILKPNKVKFETNEVLICAVLFVGALVGTIYKVATGDYISYLIGQDRHSGITQIANLLTALQWPAFIAAWILLFQGRRKLFFLILFCLINVVVIPYQFIQGSKTFLSLLMVSAVFAYYWTHGKLPRAGVLIAVFIIIAVIFPFVTNFRDNVNYVYGRIPSIMAINPKILSKQSRQEEDTHNTRAKKLFIASSRFGGIDELYALTDMVPRDMDYRYGFEYAAFFVNIIPRMVWPSKPTFSVGAVFGHKLGTVTSVTPFPYGEAYWDFGTVGVPVMMAVWGALLALLTRTYEHYFRKPKFRFLVAVYFLAQIYWIAGGEASMPSVISGIPQQVVILFVVYMVYRALRRLSRSIGAIRRVPPTQNYF